MTRAELRDLAAQRAATIDRDYERAYFVACSCGGVEEHRDNCAFANGTKRDTEPTLAEYWAKWGPGITEHTEGAA